MARLLAELSDTERDRAMARYQMLRPHLDEGVPLIRLAEIHQLDLSTLQRWLRRYRVEGLVGLARGIRSDRGTRHLALPLQHFIEGLALCQPASSIASIHRQAAKLATEQGWAIPGYFTVRNIVRALDPSLLTLAHEGSRAYAERFDLLYMRQATQSNAIWQADHSLLEITLLDEKGQPGQPWLTVILDDYSRAVAGYFLRFRVPNALDTALALHQAIWRKDDPRWQICGIPEVFYTDHGSDFTSHHLEQICMDLHIQAKFSTPGQPRGRGRLERFFRTIEQTFLGELPGYTPKGYAPVTPPQLSLDDLDKRFKEFVLNTYHQQPHSAHHQPPQALWSAQTFLPRLPDSLEELDLLLLTVATTRVVHQDGIHFQSFRYFDLGLAAYVGESVTIRYDPRDMAEIHVYHEGQFIGRAICQELAEQPLSLQEVIRQRRMRRRQLKAVLRDREDLVMAYLNVHHDQVAPPAPTSQPDSPKPPLKSYFNE